MAEFILKDWYGKEQTFDTDNIYLQDKDGQLLQFTNAAVDSEEMIYYRGLAEALMTRNAEYHSGDATKMNMKGFVTSTGGTLATLNHYSFAGFKNVEGMSFSDVTLITEDAFFGCEALKIIDITASKTIPSIGAFPGGLNGCPNLEAVIFRASEAGLDSAALPIAHGGGDNFYIYVPSAYYDTLTSNLADTVLPKERYRKLEDYPLIDRWSETFKITWVDENNKVLKTEKYLPGTVPTYTPSKDGYMFTGWNPEPVPVTGDASYKAQWTVKATFGTATWEEISAITTAGTSASSFAVGDTRTETLTYSDGTTENIEFAIAKIRDNGTMVLVLTHALAKQKPMNSSVSARNTHYNSNDLGKYLQNTVYPAFSESLKAVVREATVNYSKRKIRLLTNYNLYVYGDSTITDPDMESLPLLATAANRIRRINGTAVTYWTGSRDTSSNNYYYFYDHVDTTGTYKVGVNLGGAGGLTDNRGVVFAIDV